MFFLWEMFSFFFLNFCFVALWLLGGSPSLQVLTFKVGRIVEINVLLIGVVFKSLFHPNVWKFDPQSELRKENIVW